MRFHLCLAILLTSMTGANAAAQSILHPATEFIVAGSSKAMIEVGGGLEAATTSGGINLLLRLGFGWKEEDATVPGTPPDAAGQLVWAHVSADFAFGVPSGENGTLPYMDIEFKPVESRDCTHCRPDDPLTIVGDLQGLPMSLRRDVRLDEQLVFRVDVVGIAFDAKWKQTDQLALIARVAAEAIGYKFVSRAENASFNGFHLAELGLETGVFLPIDQDLKIRVVIGSQADLALGGSAGASLYSNINAYLAAQAEIFRNLNVFAKAGTGLALDSGNGTTEGVTQILIGASFIY